MAWSKSSKVRLMDSLAVMQPYFLPYIGYFQLMSAVDKFVVYDDVNFIKQGWVSRNRILLQGRIHMLSLPVAKVSSYRKIHEHRLVASDWRKRMLLTIRHAYAKAPFFNQVMPLIESIMTYPSHALDDFLLHSLKQLRCYMSIETPIVPTSRCYCNADLKGQERLLDICHREEADRYVNASGGVSLYNQSVFLSHNIDLFFLRPSIIDYPQLGGNFIGGLSILDVLMFNHLSDVRDMLKQFMLFRGE